MSFPMRLALGSALVAAAALSLAMMSHRAEEPAGTAADKIQWVTIEEAFELNSKKKKQKKILIDFYTDWCGWCKRMDNTTFVDPHIVEYVNENFYAVKFDAEQKGDLEINGRTYSFKPGGRRGGTHELALALAASNGRIGYPTLTFLDENGARLSTEPGYKTPGQLDVLLNYYGGDYHKELDMEAFKRVYTSPVK